MTTQLEVLNEFIEDGGVLFEHVFESSVVDAYLYEDDYFSAAIDKYVEMLDNDDVDEGFEEQLSTVLAPYFVATTPFYENLIITEMSRKMKKAVKSGKKKGAAAAQKDTQSIADKLSSGKMKMKARATTGDKIKAAPGKAGRALVGAGKGMMAKIRGKYGKDYVRGMLKAAGSRAKKIVKGTPGAVWAGTKATGRGISAGAKGAARGVGAAALGVGRAGAATGRGVAKGGKAVYSSPGKAFDAVAAGMVNLKSKRAANKGLKQAKKAIKSGASIVTG